MAEPSALRFALRRAMRRRGLLGTLVAVTFVAGLLAAIATGLAVRAPDVLVQRSFAAAPTSVVSVTISVDGDPASQNREFDALVRSAFRSAPVEVTRSVRGSASSWTVRPRAAELHVRDLADLEHGFSTLPDAARNRFATDGGTDTRGSGVGTTSAIRGAVASVRSALPVSGLVFVVSGAVALGKLASLLVTARTAEDRLLRARGASRRWFLRTGAVEALVVALPGAAVGAAVGQLVLGPLFGPPVNAAEVLVPPAAVVLLGVGSALLAVLVGGNRPFSVRSTRATVAVPGTVVALLAALAAIAFWRFRTVGGSPETRSTDPLTFIAPAAVLAALAITAALTLGPVLAALERSTARRPAWGRLLAVRLAARDLPVLLTPAIFLTLAIATATLAAGLSGTSTAFLHDSSRLVEGGAVRATVGGELSLDGPGGLLPAALRTPTTQGTAVAPVLRYTANTPNDTVSVIGVRAGALPRLVGVHPATFDAGRVAQQLTTQRHGGDANEASSDAGTVLAPASRSAREVSVALDLSAGTAVATETGVDPLTGVQTTTRVGAASSTAQVTATVWVMDAHGDLAPLDTSTASLASTTRRTETVTAQLPAGGPWRLVALDLQVSSAADFSDAAISVRGIEVAHRTVDLPRESWRIAGGAFPQGDWRNPSAGGPSIGVVSDTLRSTSPTVSTVRIMPRTGDTAVPVVISSSFAAADGVGVGDTVPLSGSVADVRARVVAVVPAVPGTTGGPAVLADLPALDTSMLAAGQQVPRIREVWGADPSDAATLRRALGSGATLTDSDAELARPYVALGTEVLLLGVTGGVVFGSLALVAATGVGSRSRRDEARSLRLAGVSARMQGRVRAFGPAAVAGWSVVAGAVAGFVAFLLLGGTMARAAVSTAPSALPVTDVFAPTVFLVVVAVVVVLAGVVVAVTARASRRAAVTAGAGVDR